MNERSCGDMKNRYFAIAGAIFLVICLGVFLTGAIQDLIQNNETSLQPENLLEYESSGTPLSADLPGCLQVVFLDVGQADAALITLDGHAMLVDGGNRDDSSLIYSVLRARGIEHLDYVIGSHPDEDHIGGLPGAFEIASVGRVFCSVDTHDTKTFQNFKKAVEGQGLSIEVPEKGQTLSFGGAKLTFIQLGIDYGNTNDNSLVVRLVYGETSFLFAGDIGVDAEAGLVESGAVLKSTVLKVPHHGSKYSSSSGFLSAVDPEIAIICVGKDNDYYYPHESALARYRDQGARVYRTDLQGDITVLSDGKRVEVVTQK